MYLVLFILLVLIIAGAPGWGYHNFGYYPSGGLGLILLIIIIVMLFGRL